MLGLANMLNANMLVVDPPGDLTDHWGAFTFSQVGKAFLLFVTIIPEVTAERLMDWLQWDREADGLVIVGQRG